MYTCSVEGWLYADISPHTLTFLTAANSKIISFQRFLVPVYYWKAVKKPKTGPQSFETDLGLAVSGMHHIILWITQTYIHTHIPTSAVISVLWHNVSLGSRSTCCQLAYSQVTMLRDDVCSSPFTYTTHEIHSVCATFGRVIPWFRGLKVSTWITDKYKPACTHSEYLGLNCLTASIF